MLNGLNYNYRKTMILNIENTKTLLQEFDFQTLFREELGWINPKNKQTISFQTKEGLFYRKAIAELSGATVFEISSSDGTIPESKIRQIISAELQKISFEHILIFIDSNRSQSIWRWLKKHDKKTLPREHYYSRGQTGDSFISKLSGLLVDLSEIENDITITDVAKKIQKALDIERVTKRFYKDYQQQFIDFLPLIEGIDNELDKRWYASVILNRLMFIYFLQKKGFIDRNNLDYLYSKLRVCQNVYGENKFYSEFLKRLFFEGFAKPELERSSETQKILGKIKYLNGGLFLKHKIEEKYPNIYIPDVAFENLLRSDSPKGLFEQFSWSLDDTPGGKDDEINPAVLGYIFEKYINQKAYGAYYTRTEITEYLCEQTVYKLILDSVNHKPAGSVDNSGTNFIDLLFFDTIEELMLGLTSDICRKLIYGENAVLVNLSLLDPACGSGAFLVAAMKTLINVYSSIFGRIEFLGDQELINWKAKIHADHPSISYFIKKQIITNNLYGVDIMEEATEIAKLRLFLALVSSAHHIDDLEPLPNIDFNIMSGNSLIRMMRVDPNKFNTHSSGLTQKPSGKIVKGHNLFELAVIQGNIFSEDLSINYNQLITEREVAIGKYKGAKNLNIDQLHRLRNNIQGQEFEANQILNRILVEDFQNLSIPFSACSWDLDKGKESKPTKRPIDIKDIESLEPFHWGYEFSEIFRKKDGFDAIITNPPWEVFKPNSKEFFAEYSTIVKKKKMTIKDFEDEQDKLLVDDEIRTAWLEYLSRFPHLSAYYRSAEQFKNQISIVNGKKAGSDINLYKLFTEQCFNLLKVNGYCGIVIPSGIYTDLGTKQLRQMLFDQSRITGLFAFENRKEIFENVHRSFKFAVLSFKKGPITTSFPAAFMRHHVEELQQFPKYGSSNLTLEFISKQSPESLSIMEIKNEFEFPIVAKMLKFPLIGADQPNSSKVIFGSEFHMTNSSYLFEKTDGDGKIPLYEGKMIYQFTHQYLAPKYWINEQMARKALLGSKADTGQVLDYQCYRLAFRDIASNTNERTTIATITPKVFHGNKLPQTIIFRDGERIISNSDLLYMLSFLNSFPFDFHIRNRVTTTLNFHFVYNTPVPRLNPDSKWYKEIVIRAAKLICISEEFSELWEDVISNGWTINSGVVDEIERNKLRAEIDGIIGHAYSFDEQEFSYILTTFPSYSLSQRQASLEYFNLLSKEIVKKPDIIAIESVAYASANQTMKEFSLYEGIYTIRDVVQISQMSIDKVTRWFKDLSNAQYEGLSGNQRSEVNSLKVSFHGLIELVVIDELRKNKFSLKQILQARADLKVRTGKLYPFATNNVKDNLKIVGKSLVFRFELGDVTLNGTGQYNLSIIEEFFKNIEFDSEGMALRLFPLKNSKLISVDPRSGGGKAVITDKGVWAEAIASAFNGMESIPMLEDQYDLTKQEILAAVEFWN